MTKTRWFALVPVIFLFSFLLTLPMLKADGIWFDENMSFFDAGAPFYDGPVAPTEILRRVYEYSPVHVPLYYFVLAGFSQLVGWNAFTARLLAAFVGLLAGAMVGRLAYRISREPLVAIGALTATVLSGWLIFFMHEARMYTLMVFMVAFLLWAYWRVQDSPAPTWRDHALLTIAATLLLYTHNFGIATLAAVGLYHLAQIIAQIITQHQDPARTRANMQTLIALVMAGVFFSPWAVIALGASRNVQSANIITVTPQVALNLIADTFRLFSNESLVLFAILIAAPVIARQRVPVFLWWTSAATLLVAVAMCAYLGTTFSRYLLGMIPPLAVLFGYGVHALNKFRPLPLLVIGAWSVLAFLAVGDPVFEHVIQYDIALRGPVKEIAETVAPISQAQDVIVYYLRRDITDEIQWPVMGYYFRATAQIPGQLTVLDTKSLGTAEAFDATVDEILSKGDRFFVGYENVRLLDYRDRFTAHLQAADIQACETLRDDSRATVILYQRGGCD